jgi:subtilisin-like proprotein convertase family protein
MNRRTLVFAGLAALPGATRIAPGSAQGRTDRQSGRTTRSAARGQRRGGLTAGRVRTQIVTRTFTSTAPVTIPAGAPTTDQGLATPYPSTIRVHRLNQGRIRKVRVTLTGLTHTAVGELHVMVVAPGNVGVILLSDTGDDENATNITLIYDQAAPGTLLEFDPIPSGTFQPKNGGAGFDPFPPPAPQGVSGHSLTVFNNRNPNGTWRLFIVDDGADDTGSLRGWSVTIQAQVRLPRQPGTGANQRRTPRRKR